ncbi:hypothetical protein [Mesorhizobium sp. IMUNJ 23232]|uniref:hypothetical protein n=1 Tax=Mesorhizobium sp. IMUNJ 23232 TaxID=3376064 RepID=UPI003791B968
MPNTKRPAAHEGAPPATDHRFAEGLPEGQYSSPAVKASLLDAAAHWLVEAGQDAPRPIMGELRRRFGLSTGEAVSVIRQANRLRAGGAS